MPFRHDYRAPHAVHQFTQFARPAVVAHRGERVGGEPAPASACVAATYEDRSDSVADAFNAFTPDQLPVLNFLASQFGICDN
ncbi:hypothetical protein CR51_22110 [Caballeronia megalochromosomata]|nr:hypothetical protein CR51_22110 [Caballeronia megalochromosomata]